jgi:mRNA-degrading endonuclease RelE of RelBE toxin-antitoxin system
MNTIHWTRKAVKQLLKMHSMHQAQVRDGAIKVVSIQEVKKRDERTY